MPTIDRGNRRPGLFVSVVRTPRATPQGSAALGALTTGLPSRARFVYVNTRSLSFGGGGQLRSGYVELLEKNAAPPAPGANRGRLYLVDNGAGKTSLRVIFNTGAAQTIATQP